jgi:hypothetical protein
VYRLPTRQDRASDPVFKQWTELLQRAEFPRSSQGNKVVMNDKTNMDMWSPVRPWSYKKHNDQPHFVAGNTSSRLRTARSVIRRETMSIKDNKM